MIDQVSYSPVSIGTWKGFLAYHVELNNSPVEVEKIAKLIEVLKDHKRNPIRNLLVEDLEEQIDDSGMLTLLKTVKDFGWLVQVVTTGRVYKQWYREADWMTCLLSLERPIWAGFYVNELIWPFTKGTPEPALPDMKKGTNLYLRVKNESFEDALQFIKKSKYNWAIEAPEGTYAKEGEVLL